MYDAPTTHRHAQISNIHMYVCHPNRTLQDRCCKSAAAHSEPGSCSHHSSAPTMAWYSRRSGAALPNGLPTMQPARARTARSSHADLPACLQQPWAVTAPCMGDGGPWLRRHGGSQVPASHQHACRCKGLRVHGHHDAPSGCELTQDAAFEREGARADIRIGRWGLLEEAIKVAAATVERRAAYMLDVWLAWR